MEDQPKPKKKRKINKYLRNFFFKSFKSRPELQAVEKHIGSVNAVTIIISKGKNILRAESGDKKEDVDFTQNEMDKLLAAFRVKKETVEECKSIFVRLDFTTQRIFIQQIKLDGTKKDIDL